MADLERIARGQRRELLDVDAQLARSLVDAYASAWSRLRDQVDALTARIQAAREAGEEPSAGWLAREARLRLLEGQLVSEVTQIARSANGAISDARWRAIRLAQEHAAAATEAAMGAPPPGVGLSFNQLPVDAVRALVADLSPDASLGALLQELVPAAREAVRAALTDGLILGEGPAAIARRMRAALGGNAVRATTIARTTLIRTYKSASLASYRQNADVVKGWIWLASLGPRTCAACLAMHGTRHGLDETFHDHPRGRCAAVPWVRTWAELGYDVPDRPQEIGSGADWFAEQDASLQRRVLGPAKLAAYRAGDLTLADLAGAQRSAAWGKTLTEKSLTDVLGADRARELIAGARSA